MLEGKKTYLAAGAAILGAIAGALAGQLDWGNAVGVIVNAILSITLRHGVITQVK